MYIMLRLYTCEGNGVEHANDEWQPKVVFNPRVRYNTGGLDLLGQAAYTCFLFFALQFTVWKKLKKLKSQHMCMTVKSVKGATEPNKRDDKKKS